MAHTEVRACAPDLSERVFARLGLARAPDPDLAGLDAVYGAYCQRVPFDNIQRRLAAAVRRSGPLPGASEEEFWARWLEEGTGGTCWAGAGALGGLLAACGFTVRRAVATMHPGPHLKEPNHGALVVDLEGESFLVDPSTTNGVALPLGGGERPGVLGGAAVRRGDAGETLLFWRPLHMPAQIPCRIDEIGVGEAVFAARHEATRVWSLFNYSLNLRVARGDAIVGIAMGRRLALGADGSVTGDRLDPESRLRFLVEVAGISESVARAVPEDDSTPPPPGVPAERWAEMLASLTRAPAA